VFLLAADNAACVVRAVVVRASSVASVEFTAAWLASSREAVTPAALVPIAVSVLFAAVSKLRPVFLRLSTRLSRVRLLAETMD